MIAKKTGVEILSSYYRYGICECWKCTNEIVVFAWPKESDFDKSEPKAKPIPQTIQYRYSKAAGSKYWVNTCPYCKSIQGDYFLFFEPDGPFFGIRCEEDSQDAYDRDMQKIVGYAVYRGLLGEN